MSPSLQEITLLLGVDRQHLEELRWTWPTWVRFKPEILQMPAVVFYDSTEVQPADLAFLREHGGVRFVPWEMPMAETQREKMITGWIHVAAQEVKTPWYLKLDTDVVATGPGEWIREAWFQPDERGRAPVFVSARWGYSKPRYVMDLLDDWGDRIPGLQEFPRLNLPYSTESRCVRHRRIISWVFFGQTAFTRQARGWLGPSGRLSYPSQDSFLFYAARRSRRHYVRVTMSRYAWKHTRFSRIPALTKQLGIPPAPASGQAVRPPAAPPRQAAESGVIYYNTGTGCCARLLVSLASLREHYDGPVTILSEGEASHRLCAPIAAAFDANLQPWDCGVPPGRHRHFLAKTQYHRGSPYRVTIALDSDTLVVGGLEPLFAQTEDAGFCVARLAQWRSDGPTIASRIRQWAPWLPEDVEPALRFGPAINCGVIAFRRGAEILDDWLRLALPGRETFIPDEVCCQVILHRYPHRVVDGCWNRSCKHDDPAAPGTKIIHYHGRKHCRAGLPFGAARWVGKFEELLAKNVANVSQWAPAGDRQLKRHLHRRPARPPAMSDAVLPGQLLPLDL